MTRPFSFEEKDFEMDSELDESGEFGEEFEDTEFDLESDAYLELDDGEGKFDGEFVEETRQLGCLASMKFARASIAPERPRSM